MEIIHQLTQLYQAHRNPEYAAQMSRYMKNRFPFFGMQSGPREMLHQEFIAQHGLPDYETTKDMVLQLFALPEREYHYFAILLLIKHKKNRQPGDIALLERLLTSNSWWDSVDYINGSVLGDFFLKYPDLMQPVTDKWSLDENIWLKRSSIIFQLKYRQNTRLDLLASHILQNNSSKEFFVQKAIGWALREYSKTDAQWVEHFVHNHELKPLSRREAMKRIEKSR